MNLVAFSDKDREQGFDLYKRLLKPFIEQVFGWDEHFYSLEGELKSTPKQLP
jgi:hypothetical protein